MFVSTNRNLIIYIDMAELMVCGTPKLILHPLCYREPEIGFTNLVLIGSTSKFYSKHLQTYLAHTHIS